MKTTSNPIIFAFTFLALAASAFAQEPSPREQFPNAVAAFRKGASEDNARKLAELHKQLDPPPAVPEDAEFRSMKGTAFVKQAGDAAAFAKAAAEFQAAIVAAPWVGEYHYNLAVCEKSAGHFSAAQSALKFAQILARDDKERRDNLALRADLEATQELAAAKIVEEKRKVEEEKAAAAKAADTPQAREAALMKSLEGAVFSISWTNIKRTYRISKGRVVVIDRRLASGGPLCQDGAERNGPIGEEKECPDCGYRLVGRHGERKHNFGIDSIEIAEDGQAILEKNSFNGKITDIVFKRQ